MSKRTRILIDPKVQWSIAGRIMAHWVLLLIALVAIGAMVRLMASTDADSFASAAWEALMSQRAVACVMFVLIPVFVRDTLRLSNKFAGPMYRIRTELKRLKDGEPAQKIKLRNGDFWTEVADDFNQVATQLEQLKAENAALRSQLNEADLKNTEATSA